MIFKSIIKFIGILILGLLGGFVFGITLALCLFGLIYLSELLIVFAVIVSLFYLVSIWRQFRQRNYLLIIKRFVEIIFFASLLNAMFLMEEGLIEFNSFEWNVIYACFGLATILSTVFFILETYFRESWLYKEMDHIINGMQFYGLLPDFAEKEKEEKEIISR